MEILSTEIYTELTFCNIFKSKTINNNGLVKLSISTKLILTINRKLSIFDGIFTQFLAQC